MLHEVYDNDFNKSVAMHYMVQSAGHRYYFLFPFFCRGKERMFSKHSVQPPLLLKPRLLTSMKYLCHKGEHCAAKFPFEHTAERTFNKASEVLPKRNRAQSYSIQKALCKFCGKCIM